MKQVIKPKGGLYVFGVIFLYLFFMFLPVFETVALIVESSENTLEISNIILVVIGCYLFPIFCLVLITIEITMYKAEIAGNSVIISSTHFFWDVLFQKKKKLKYEFDNLQAMQLQKGILYPNGYTIRFALIYDRKTKYLDLSRFSQKQVEIIKKNVLEIAKNVNGFEPIIQETKDKIWLAK